MGLLSRAFSARYDEKATSPGKAVLVMTQAAEAVTREVELYHPPGLISAPTKEDRIIETRIGAAGRVAIASHNYRAAAETPVKPGEALLFSTDKEGTAPQASLMMGDEGSVKLVGEGDVKIKAKGTADDETSVAIEGAKDVSVSAEGDVKIKAKDKAAVVIEEKGAVKVSGTEVHLKGSAKTLVTYKELNDALTLFVTSVKANFKAIAADDKLKAAGMKYVDTAIPTSLDISDANAANLKTDG